MAPVRCFMAVTMIFISTSAWSSSVSLSTDRAPQVNPLPSPMAPATQSSKQRSSRPVLNRISERRNHTLRRRLFCCALHGRVGVFSMTVRGGSQDAGWRDGALLVSALKSVTKGPRVGEEPRKPGETTALYYLGCGLISAALVVRRRAKSLLAMPER